MLPEEDGSGLHTFLATNQDDLPEIIKIISTVNYSNSTTMDM